jgi:RsmE family RNA methyltransferase
MIPRFFCPFPLHPGATVELAADAAHHALKVLRVAAGDTAILFDGRGGQWRATLNPAGKGLRATLEEFDDADSESPLALTLVQGLPSGDKMDLVVQKAVEMGVRRIQPVAAKRSVVRLSGERAERRVEHWRNIAIAACEQSGRNRVPPWRLSLICRNISESRRRKMHYGSSVRPVSRCACAIWPHRKAPSACWWVRRAASRTANCWRRVPPASVR